MMVFSVLVGLTAIARCDVAGGVSSVESQEVVFPTLAFNVSDANP